MSKMSSKWRGDAESRQDRSACLREPLVKINLRPGSSRCCARPRVRLQRRMVDVVHIVEIVVGRHAVRGHQSTQRRAVAR